LRAAALEAVRVRGAEAALEETPLVEVVGRLSSPCVTLAVSTRAAAAAPRRESAGVEAAFAMARAGRARGVR
jgi:hypothetical protein